MMRVLVGMLCGTAIVAAFDASPGGWISAAVALAGALLVRRVAAR